MTVKNEDSPFIIIQSDIDIGFAIGRFIISPHPTPLTTPTPSTNYGTIVLLS